MFDRSVQIITGWSIIRITMILVPLLAIGFHVNVIPVVLQLPNHSLSKLGKAHPLSAAAPQLSCSSRQPRTAVSCLVSSSQRRWRNIHFLIPPTCFLLFGLGGALFFSFYFFTYTFIHLFFPCDGLLPSYFTFFNTFHTYL